MPNYTPVLIGPNPPQGLPLAGTLTGGEMVPMDQPTGAIPAWLTCKASLTTLSTYFNAHSGAITSVVGTANEIAVSTVAGVATLSFSPNIIIPAPPSGQALAVNGAAGAYAESITGSSTSGSSYGLNINAGFTAADAPLVVNNYAQTATFLRIYGDGHGTLGPSATVGESWDANGHWVFGTPATSGYTINAKGFQANGSAVFVAGTGAVGTGTGPAAFVQFDTLNAALVMNSAGANYGTIGNVGTQIWGLGSSLTIGPAGNTVLQWSAGGAVAVNTPATSVTAFAVYGAASNYTALFQGSSTTNGSYGPIIEAGTSSSDEAFLVYAQNASSLFFQIRGDGYMAINNNGMTIGNISGNAIPLVVDAPAANWGVEVIGSSTAGSSYGLLIEAGTGTGDFALYVGSQANAHQLFQVRGDGSINCYNPTGGFLGAGTINVSGGYYVNGVLISGTSSSFTGTLTGCTTSPTETMYYSISGNNCTVSLPTALTGTSNSVNLTITGLPAACSPAHAVGGVATIESSGTWANGQWAIAASGTTITFAAVTGTSSGGFVASGAKGVWGAFTFSYPLN